MKKKLSTNPFTLKKFKNIEQVDTYIRRLGKRIKKGRVYYELGV